MIQCKWIVPNLIVQVEIDTYPLHLKNIFRFVFYLQKIYILGDLTTWQERFPYPAFIL